MYIQVLFTAKDTSAGVIFQSKHSILKLPESNIF